MKKQQIFLAFAYIAVMLISYGIHTFILSLIDSSHDVTILNISYVFNTLFTIVLVIVIVLLHKKQSDQLGFIFMAGSLLKMGTFLLLSKIFDFQLTKSIFLDFFVPYVLSLIIEVWYVSKIMNSIK